MGEPVLAITMGDAAGIGPELIVKVLSQGWVREMCRPFVVGDLEVMCTIGQVTGTALQFASIADLSEARFAPLTIDVLCPEGLQVAPDAWGVLDPAMGQAAARCLRQAFEMVTAGHVQGVVSAPLNKEAFHLAGYSYQDELAYIADLTASPEPFILGAMRSLFTVSVAEHVAFRDILNLVNVDRVLWYIRKMDGALRRVGVPAPRVAVAALNVHGGEGGLFGREEIEQIGPAIQEAAAQGIDVQGPVPADMVFVRALEGEFDGVVCMYHDQANIARKLQPKSEGATLFMGLPAPCGTTAHGTAFDKAGQGIADPGSLAAALRYTAMLARSEGLVG